MAKLSSTAALLAALLLVAHAAAFRTTITTVETSDNYKGGSSQECSQEVQRLQNLRDCKMYLREQMRGGGGYDEVVNQSQHYNQCCNQLRQMKEWCRCDGLRMAIEQDQGQMRGQEMRDMMRTAENLPSMCRMRPSSCDFETPYY